MHDFDLAVIGLGPAGSTLCRLLGGRTRILALDRKSLHHSADTFTKPCGGLLAPDAQAALFRAGLTLPLSVLADPQLFAVRTLDLDTPCERFYPRSYLNLNRAAFDRWLMSLISDDVDVRQRSQCVSLTRAGSGFRLVWQEGTIRREATARRVVGADGASSLVRRTFFAQHPMRSRLAIQEWFRASEAESWYTCVFSASDTDCYAWSLHKDEFLIFGGAFPLKNARQHFADCKQRFIERTHALPDPVRREACLVQWPRSGSDIICGEQDVFLVGEAAGFISPSSLEGISYAMESAHCLAQALCTHDPFAAYRVGTLALRRKIAAKRLKAGVLYTPWLRRLIMRSGLGAIRAWK